MFRIEIYEVTPTLASPEAGSVSGELVVERFRQTVDTLDVPRIVAMINTRPRVRRTKKDAKP